MYKRFLYISDHELFVYHVAKNKQIQKLCLPNDEASSAEIIRYLEQNTHIPISVIVDSIQEQYHIARLPHVFGKDRSDLWYHKKKRLFEDTPYTYATIQDREPDGRKDDKVLFSAIMKPLVIQPWLKLINQFKIPIKAVSSLPILSEKLLKYLPKSPYTLLVVHTPRISAHCSHGLRQSFFMKQKLQLSRLTPLNISTTEQESYSHYVIGQIIKTQQYLENSNVLPAGTRLQVVILTETRLLSTLNNQLRTRQLPDLQFHLIDIREFAYQMGLRTEHTSLFLHQLVGHQLLRHLFNNHYGNWQDRRYFLFQNIRTATYVASILFLASAATAGGFILHDAWQMRKQGENVQSTVEKRESELRQLQSIAPNLPFEPVYIRNIVDVGQHLKTQDVSPKSILIKVSQVLNDYPKLIVSRLEWGIGSGSETIFASYNEVNEDEVEKKRETPDPRATLFRNPRMRIFIPTVEETPDNFLEGVRLHGKISPFDGDYRQTLRMYNQFVDALKLKDNRWKINKIQLPYKKVLQGSIGRDSQEEDVPFAIEILIEHAYANAKQNS